MQDASIYARPPSKSREAISCVGNGRVHERLTRLYSPNFGSCHKTNMPLPADDVAFGGP